MNPVPTIVGLGEILWDLLPSGCQLGGAPANFAYCSHLLGNRAVVASRIGNDELGNEIRQRIQQAGIGHEFLQTDSIHPTGTVLVELDPGGQPTYNITHGVAWDFMEWTAEWESLARSADVVCFGSLAQRSEPSRTTILKFVETTRPDALRIFDINLRQEFYSKQIIEESLRHANVAKLNHDELLRLEKLLGFESSPSDDASFCRRLISHFGLQLACVTYGSDGSLLCSALDTNRHYGFKVAVKDTVGSGDAFTAGLVHGLLKGESLAEINDLANRMGAWVASCSGGMPSPPQMT